MVKAIIFDCDGVLADTERDGHRPAFNQMFREFGLPVEWSEDDYAAKLQIAGGKERMASLLTPEGWALLEALPPYDEGTAIRLGQHLREQGHDPVTVAAGSRACKSRASVARASRLARRSASP